MRRVSVRHPKRSSDEWPQLPKKLYLIYQLGSHFTVIIGFNTDLWRGILTLNRLLQLGALGLIGWAIQGTAIAAAEENVGACDKAMERAQLLNASQLWQGASVCEKVDDLHRAKFLTLAGRIRGSTDIRLLEAASVGEKLKSFELHGPLYAQDDGPGDEEIYRDVDQTDRLIDELSNWRPVLNDSYYPGWEYTRIVDGAKYSQSIACGKAEILKELNWIVSLFRNDEFYEARKEFFELLAANPGPITPESDVDKQLSALRSRTGEISNNLFPRTKLEECDFDQVN